MKSQRLIRTFVISFAFLVVAVSGQNGPSIPSWVHPGLTVTYDGVSAFMRNGQPSQSVQVVMTTHVTAVAGGKVSGSTLFQTVGTPLRSTHAWTCTSAGNCSGDATGFSGQFWVDPANPTASVHGAHGEPYTINGHSPYSYGGHTWDSTTMSYKNPATGWQLFMVFETKTGLVLAYSETSPGQQVHTYFKGMSQ
jgi:hypothetical protein